MTITDKQIAEIRREMETDRPMGWKADLALDYIPALLSALEAANKRADEAEALVRMLEDAETVEIIQTLRARVAELEGAVMKLRAALMPFADVAEWDIGDSESDRDTFRPIDPRCSISGNISIGHLRRALEAVEESEWVADKIRAQQTNDAALKGASHEQG